MSLIACERSPDLEIHAERVIGVCIGRGRYEPFLSDRKGPFDESALHFYRGF